MTITGRFTGNLLKNDIFQTLRTKISNMRAYVWSVATKRVENITAFRVVTAVEAFSNVAFDVTSITSVKKTETV